jgi:hypothetical protein
MANILPVQFQHSGRLAVHSPRVEAGRQAVDRGMATSSAEMVIRKSDSSIHDGEIGLAVLVQFDNGVIQILVEGCLFPCPATASVVLGRCHTHHIFHAAGQPAQRMGFEHRQ